MWFCTDEFDRDVLRKYTKLDSVSEVVELREHDDSGIANTLNKLRTERNFKYSFLTVISVIKLKSFLNLEKLLLILLLLDITE